MAKMYYLKPKAVVLGTNRTVVNTDGKLEKEQKIIDFKDNVVAIDEETDRYLTEKKYKIIGISFDSVMIEEPTPAA